MMKETVAEQIHARAEYLKGREGMEQYMGRSQEILKHLVENHLPHGSGFDSPPAIDYKRTTRNRFFIYGSYHVMNELGMYEGWIEFVVKVEARFYDVDVDVTFHDDESRKLNRRYDLRDYIADAYYSCLTTLVHKVYVL